MKKNSIVKKIVIIAMIAITTLVVTVTAFATASKPYGSYNVSKTTSKGEAVIYQCSCRPVNNYLKASCRVQYLNSESGRYTWTAWTNSSDTNTTGRVASWTVKSGNQVSTVEGKFQARCGSGTIKNYSASK